MPKISLKRQYIKKICVAACYDMILSETGDWTTFEDVVEDVILLNCVRYGIPRNPVPKSNEWYTIVLPEYSDELFRTFMRVSRPDFGKILSLIEDHPVFNLTGSKQQMGVDKQLAITLYKLGADGGGSSICNVSAMFGIGGGGSLMNIVERVLKAILSLEKQWITWPGEEERKEIRSFMADKMPKCMGYVDGSHINLEEAPLDDPESYFTRKQRYAIHMQAVCDNNRLIRSLHLGYPGSVHDARVFANSEIGKHPENYLSDGEWIAGDSAYGVTEHLLTPFRRNATIGTMKQRKEFNKYFSSYRVNVECCFGILKETFGSLKGLRIRVDKRRGHQLACEWILGCCILYNIVKDSLPNSPLEEQEDQEDDDLLLNNFNNNNIDTKRTALFNFVTGKLSI